MNRVQRFPWQVLLLVPAILLMLDGLWAGLQRMGWALPHLHAGLAALHGPLMVAGFLGTLISLERAVALHIKWFYLAPLLSAVGAVMLVLGAPPALGIALLTLGSAVFVVMMLLIVRQHPAPFTYMLALGAAMWLIGNALWLLGLSIAQVVLWWSGFLILTIAGERLELSRLMRFPRNVGLLLWLGVAVFCVGVIADTFERAFLPEAALFIGSRLAGLGMLALAAWLLRFDIVRRNIRLTGLTRFIAVCLFSGYIWLGIGGALRLIAPGATAGMYYDALLHTVFVGFVFGMIFAHAPIILPAVIRRAVPYAPVLYVPWAMLQIGLVMRVIGDLMGELTLRQWGGMLNALAIVLYFAMTLALMVSAARSQAAPAKRADSAIH